MVGEAPVHSPRSDLIVGGLWTVAGLAILVGSARIDRLSAQGIEWFAAPGLLPAILGVCIALCGALIALRGARAGAARASASAANVTADPWAFARTAITLVLCLGFAAGLVGRGLPFGVAAFVYLFLHVLLLEWPQRRDKRARVRGVALAAGVALGGALIVPFVFEQFFLVRLP